MTDLKATEGPYRATGQNGHCGITICRPENDDKLATVYLNEIDSRWAFGTETINRPENEGSRATAHLLAAAWDMYRQHDFNLGALELLEMAIKSGDAQNELLFRIKEMKDGIKNIQAKARGE